MEKTIPITVCSTIEQFMEGTDKKETIFAYVLRALSRLRKLQF